LILGHLAREGELAGTAWTKDVHRDRPRNGSAAVDEYTETKSVWVELTGAKAVQATSGTASSAAARSIRRARKA
jgi:hypothetical protein